MTGSKVRIARLAFLDKIHLAPPRDEVTEDIILWETTHFSCFLFLFCRPSPCQWSSIDAMLMKVDSQMSSSLLVDVVQGSVTRQGVPTGS